MNRICVARGITSKLAEYHNCTVQQVRAALRGSVESPLSELIRNTAKSWGYKEVRAIPAFKIQIKKIETNNK